MSTSSITTIRTIQDAWLWLAQNGHGELAGSDHVRIWAGCTRCGGEGGSRAWRDWTCYRCGGEDTRNVYKRIPIKAYAQDLKRKQNAEARKVAKAKAEAEAQNAAFDAQLAANPELAAALQGDHAILRDLSERRCELSEKQVELALKIARQLAEREAEARVAAPEGRVEVEGDIISVKWRDSDYGGAWKMTVKVETPEGSWLCWGTCPAALLDAATEEWERRLDFQNGLLETAPEDSYADLRDEVERLRDGGSSALLRGVQVRFTATLSRSDEAHFAFFKRPAKTQVLSWARPAL